MPRPPIEHDDQHDNGDEPTPMSACDIESGLLNILESLPEPDENGDDDICVLADIARGMAESLPGLRSVKSYRDRAMLTTDKGLVLAFDDGSEFQVTIVQSRRPR